MILACMSSSYLLFTMPCLCISKIFTPSATPFNGARNACWHFLAQSLGMVSSQQRYQETPGRPPHSGGAMGSTSARIYHCSISPGSIQGIVIYIFPRDGYGV